MYGRSIAGRELTFEASGALQQASLVMRDRETDSWWSLMRSAAIGGPLDGTRLEELAVSEKTTWGRWRAAHPATLVLSVDGEEHVADNPYDHYFSSDETFRGLVVDDTRLPAKEPVYSFFFAERPYAVPHAAAAGGRLFALPGSHAVFLHRAPGEPFFASTEAWLLDPAAAERARSLEGPAAIRAWLRGGEAAAGAGAAGTGSVSTKRLGGFDTFWYNWAAVNRGSELLR